MAYKLENQVASGLFAGSYDDVKIIIDSSETSGGRKIVTKQLPNSDLQIVEDLGKRVRSFQITGTVSSRLQPQEVTLRGAFAYYNDRDNLLSTLEKGGGKILVHPWYGSIENVHCVEYTISESTNSLGDSNIELQMEVGTSVGISKVVRFSGSAIVINEAIAKQNKADFTPDNINQFGFIVLQYPGAPPPDAPPSIPLVEEPDIDPLPTSNNVGISLEGPQTHSALLEEIAEVGNLFDTLKGVYAANLANISKLTNALVNFQSDLNQIARAPGILADRINGLFAAIDSTFTSFATAIEVYKNAFSFGDDSVFANLNFPSTPSLRSQVNNHNLVKGMVQSQALSYSYLNASQIDYGSLEEIETVSKELEEQYQKIVEGDFIGEDLQDLVTEMREVTQGFFDEQKLTVRKVITINTLPTTARVLSYQYYGSSSTGQQIIDLNELGNPYLLEGDIRILTE